MKSTGATPSTGQAVDIDMGVDWREGEPVTLSVGPVLSLDDAVGNKVSALYSRAEARDCLDVDSIRASGKFTDAELIASALVRDPGFEVSMFVAQLDSAQKLRPDRVADYGVEPAQLDVNKSNLPTIATEIRRPSPSPEARGYRPTSQRGGANEHGLGRWW